MLGRLDRDDEDENCLEYIFVKNGSISQENKDELSDEK